MPEPQTQSALKDQFIDEVIPVGFPWRLLTFSFIIFLFSIFIFFGLKFGYTSYLDGQTAALDKKIEELGSRISADEQARFVLFYSQLANLKKILDDHGFSGNIINFLEKQTLGQIYYTDAAFSADRGELALKGFAASSEALVYQLALFDNAPELSSVILNQTNADRQGVSFAVTLGFKPEFFERPSL
ncbi:MAG TPA: hypothetical protein VNK70_00780 [Candidatus Paceibacterota bacterium]|nr:hypothetical protein [Candidatus Paceibacterota bacterium]